MTRRTLVPTMLKEASDLQGHMTQFQVTQSGFFEDNADLLQAVADCAACIANLISELGKVRELGD